MALHMFSAPAVPHGLQLASRVIVHLDLDCFYVQVEQKRLGIPGDVPCAVQQWQGLIAVNYAARAAGITRHMRVTEAKKHCPELQLVHVQTIGCVQQPGTSNTAAASGAAAASAPEAARTASTAAAAEGDVEGSALDRGSSKACLQRYRRASAAIMSVLASLCPGCPLEKASIDEAYLDITAAAVCELRAAERGGHADDEDGDGPDDGPDAGPGPGSAGLASLLESAAAGSVVLGDGGLQPDKDYDRLAAAGAVVALRLRAAVLSQLGFTVSAGIAPNKLLAKIGSAKNKPNKQTVVLPRAVEGLMQGLSLGKVKGLGGKLGAQLEGLGVDTAGAAAALTWDTLLTHFGSKARWVYNSVRGVDDEPVVAKDKVKSINSCKSFNATSDPAAVGQWLAVLAAELAERMGEDEAEHNRRPRSLVLQYRGGTAAASTSSSRGATPDRSIRGAMPTFTPRDTPNTESIAAAALALFKRIKPAPWPLTRLALVATEFSDIPGAGGAAAGSGAAMARFLAAGSSDRNKQQQHQSTAQEADAHPQQLQKQHDPGQQTSLQQLAHASQAKHNNAHVQRQSGLERFLLQPKQQDNKQGQCQQQHDQQPHSEHQQQQQLLPADLPAALAELPSTSQQMQQPVQGQLGNDQQQHQEQQVPALPDQQLLQAAGSEPNQHRVQQRQEEAAQQPQEHLQQYCHELQPAGQQALGSALAAEAAAAAVCDPCSSPAAPSHANTEAAAATAGSAPGSPTAVVLEAVDVAEQARILRDIEIQGLLQRHHQQSVGHAAGSSSSRKRQHSGTSSRVAPAKKQSSAQNSGKQMSIAALLAQHNKQQ